MTDKRDPFSQKRQINPESNSNINQSSSRPITAKVGLASRFSISQPATNRRPVADVCPCLSDYWNLHRKQVASTGFPVQSHASLIVLKAACSDIQKLLGQ